MQKGSIITIVVILVIVGALLFILNTHQNPSTGNAVQTGNSAQSSETSSPGSNLTTLETIGSNLTGTSPETKNVIINMDSFSPAVLTVNVGDTVVWTNMDKSDHLILSDASTQLTSPPLHYMDTYSHTFTMSGDYQYHCEIHTSMTGTIIVK